jgi:hypothetical protein
MKKFALSTIVLLMIVGGVIGIKSCRSKYHDKELFRNEKCVIVMTAWDGALTQDKFHTPVFVKTWLVQRVADTTQFAELTSYDHNYAGGFRITNELWYNKGIGDTVFFEYICKDRFFKIKGQHER